MSESLQPKSGDTTRSACSRCGSRHLMHNVDVITPSSNSLGDVTARIFRPRLKHFTLSVTGKIKACVCSDCGHTELVTDNLAELWEVYSERNR